MTCRDCDAAIDHCHGTLLIHSAGLPECTESGCVDLEYVRHFLVLECVDITGGCRCVAEIDLMQAS